MYSTVHSAHLDAVLEVLLEVRHVQDVVTHRLVAVHHELDDLLLRLRGARFCVRSRSPGLRGPGSALWVLPEESFRRFEWC